MGILDKVKFWKKDTALKDETAMPPMGEERGMPATPDFGAPRPYPAPPPSQPSYPSPTPAQQPRAFQERFSSRDMEMINAKLDAIKANLESINQRIANLERIAYGETRGY